MNPFGRHFSVFDRSAELEILVLHLALIMTIALLSACQGSTPGAHLSPGEAQSAPTFTDRAIFKLAPGQAEGRYAFAFSADQAAELKFRDSDGVYKTLIASSTQPAAYFSCSSRIFDLKHDTEIVVEMITQSAVSKETSIFLPLMKQIDPTDPADPCSEKNSDGSVPAQWQAWQIQNTELLNRALVDHEI